METVRDNFRKYRDRNLAARLTHIENALKALGNSKFQHISSLAKAVARIVTEFERNSAFADGVVIDHKPMSHITLLNNKKYRAVLERAKGFVGVVKRGESVRLEDYEALKIKCASLSAKVAMLEQCILNIDGRIPEEPHPGEGISTEKNQSIGDEAFLLDFLDDFQSEMQDAIEIIHPEQVGKYHPEPGLYGPMSLIRSYAELERLQAIRERVERELRANKRELHSSQSNCS